MEEMEITNGLLPTEDDPRDYDLGRVFGLIPIETIPDYRFVVAEPLVIKNQFKTDMCTGYALASVLEDTEEVILDPMFAFAMIKKRRGEWRGYGGDLRSGCKVAEKIGLIERDKSPLWRKEVNRKHRDFVANWENWEKFPELEKQAAVHKQESYFKVTGPYDTFDNIRMALWQNKKEKRSIFTGCKWKSGWMSASNGIIPNDKRAGGVGHAFKVFGQEPVGDEMHILIQNSMGEKFGDKGIFKFPREVVNREFTFKEYMYKDMPKKEAFEANFKASIKYDKKEGINPLMFWWNKFKKRFYVKCN